MLSVTPHGHSTMLEAITRVVRTMHLYTDLGELTGYDYAPKSIKGKDWSGGAYPEQLWEFEAGDPTRVMGYYLADANGRVLLTEEFGVGADGKQGYDIGRKGDRIAVTVALNLQSTQEA